MYRLEDYTQALNEKAQIVEFSHGGYDYTVYHFLKATSDKSNVYVFIDVNENIIKKFTKTTLMRDMIYIIPENESFDLHQALMIQKELMEKEITKINKRLIQYAN